MPADEETMRSDKKIVQQARTRSVSSLSIASGEVAASEAGGGGVWAALGAEAAGTALLVLGSCLPADAAPLHRALLAGAVFTMVVQCFDHVSGAILNPAISLVGAVVRRLSWRRAVAYSAAQLVGAAAGAGLLRALLGGGAASCVTGPAPWLGVVRAAALEALLAACLALASCSSWDARTARLHDSWPLRIGVTVGGLVLAGGELTGASMNPARSFGPALCSADWTHHWVYWAGPLSGAGAAALLYRAAWLPPPAL